MPALQLPKNNRPINSLLVPSSTGCQMLSGQRCGLRRVSHFSENAKLGERSEDIAHCASTVALLFSAIRWRGCPFWVPARRGGHIQHRLAVGLVVYFANRLTYSLDPRTVAPTRGPPRLALDPHRSEGSCRATIVSGVSTCGSPSAAASCIWLRLSRALARLTLWCPSLPSVR
jgi:hypothetical protein